MRFGAVFGTKDEAELVGPSLDHLRRIGIDLVIAYDVNSTDGTRDLLEQRRNDSDFWLLNVDDRNADEFETWTRAILALVKSADLDWVIFLDADEFWLPAGGTLSACEGLAAYDALAVDRYNVCAPRDAPPSLAALSPGGYDDLLLYVGGAGDLKGELRDNPDAVWVRAATERKIMARPERIGSIELGSHNIHAPDSTPLRRGAPADLIIAHYPFTTRSRFRRKIANIRRAVRAQSALGADAAWHWRRWLELDEKGLIDDEFDRAMPDAAAVAALRANGGVRSAADLFRERLGSRAGRGD